MQMNSLTLTVSEEDINERLDSFLSFYLNDYTRSQLQKIVNLEQVFVNGKNQKNSYKVKENDKILINFPEKILFEIKPENIKLDIIYEDENMLVINKPKNMLTHPTQKETTNTLVNALLYYCGKNLSDINGEFRPGIVHRLDRNTSGLLMVAKNNKTHEALAKQIKSRTVTKKYRAIVHGVVKNDFGIIDAPIGRHKTQMQKMAVSLDGKPSITEYKVLERFKNHTYLELSLITGRTHQIRVHLSSIGHSIVNDSLYTNQKSKVKTTEQVLQSYSLTFISPTSDNILSFEIQPDEDIEKVLKYLRSLK